MNKPWPATNLGWIIALIGLILAILNVIGGTSVSAAYLFILAFLAILL